jgi:hypothetical protein
MTYKTAVLSFDNRVRIFWVLVAVCFASTILYIYAVTTTVSNTVSRATLETQVSTMAARIGELEFTYIGMKNSVTLETAYAHGFKDVSSPTYIARADGPALSVNFNQ